MAARKLEATCIRCFYEGEVDQALRDMPEQGWELVNVIYHNGQKHLYFKREVQVHVRIDLIARPEDRLAL